MLVRIVIFVVGFLTGFLGANLILQFTGNTPDGLYIKQDGKWRRISEEAFNEIDEDDYSAVMRINSSCRIIKNDEEGEE